jgi:hypothetical protein
MFTDEWLYSVTVLLMSQNNFIYHSICSYLREMTFDLRETHSKYDLNEGHACHQLLTSSIALSYRDKPSS